MQLENTKSQTVQYLTQDELNFINERCSALRGDDRVVWLQNYKSACDRRVVWGRVSGLAVLAHIDFLLGKYIKK